MLSGILIQQHLGNNTWAEKWEAAGSPSNTMLPGPRPTSVSIQTFGHNRHGPKIGVGAVRLWGWVPILHNVTWAEAYLHTKCHLDPSSRLAIIHVPKSGSAAVGVLVVTEV